MFFSFCLGEMLGNLFYNGMFRLVYNALNGIPNGTPINIKCLFWYPYKVCLPFLKQGLDIISQPGINPIVALANMGTYYINFLANYWLMIIEMSFVVMILPFGLFFFALMALTLPLIFSWLTVMASIGL